MKTSDLGILLNRITYGENSLIATFFTEKSGIQKYLFLGGKKKAGNLFPLGIYELTFYKKPSSDLGKVDQAILVNAMNDIFNNPIKSVITFFVAEIIYQSIKSEEKDSEMWFFITNQINKLEFEKQVKTYPIFFLLNFIIHTGLKPLVEHNNSGYFDLEQGVFTSNPINVSSSINSEASSVIRNYFLEVGVNFELLNKHSSEIIEILIFYLTFHTPNFKGSKALKLAREILN